MVIVEGRRTLRMSVGGSCAGCGALLGASASKLSSRLTELSRFRSSRNLCPRCARASAAPLFPRVGDSIVRFRHRLTFESTVDYVEPGDPWARLIGFLPAGVGQRATVTFATWGGGSRGTTSSVEVHADEAGQPNVANIAAVAAGFAAIDDGLTVMVQVRSADEQATATEPVTIRAWVLTTGRVRALDGDALRDCYEIAGHPVDDERSPRFETGWPITGEAGGVRAPAHVSGGRFGHRGRRSA